ncbi:hypothetical protein [Hymenobacter psychrotolerans]|uniref:Uncharacterized protein n=1 Tax=Hymenobacter psychrotolerans DSM 18569 TaxID=1121959 RepID=A0A1M6WMD8_9BACT|nr:hypothetical protein [Hymenobacter psychrotolerans]SHK94695.1 hypothetical protein SAMN02746009_01837 [Hymenobacter psychrotolerans DSM 18569]
MYSIEYKMRCRNCGEGKQFPQVSYYYDTLDSITSNMSEFSQAEDLASSLLESDITCDWCHIALWDVYSIKINDVPVMRYADDLFYYRVNIDKDENEDISFEEEYSKDLHSNARHNALNKLYQFVSRIDENRFGSNELEFGGDAELVVSFKKTDNDFVLHRIEILCFTGFDKNDLVDTIAYTNNNLYEPELPRIYI